MKNYVVIILEIVLAIYIIILTGPLYVYSFPFIAIQILSILFMLWAYLIHRISKKHLSKKIPKGVFLLKEGPYEFLRHPVYTGLLLFVSTYIQEYFTFTRALAFILFVIFIFIKVKFDEEETELYFKNEFNDYKKNTKKLIPYIY